MLTEQLARLRFAFLLMAALVVRMMSSDFVAVAQVDDPLAAPLESARRKRDPVQLESLRTQLEQRLSQNPNNAVGQYELATVESFLADVSEMRKDKKAAATAVDKAIEAVQRSIQLNEKSADAHSLLADLYGRKIGLGGGMFLGPRFGPKIGEENKRAMALNDKNPRVWASTGRQYLMAPKTFGGDVSKAIDSFKKSLTLDPNQDETWFWLAKAYEKQSDKANARDAIQHALQLNPQSQLAQETSKSLEK
jgi:cytochrome c-type biogenesis protein CcmH/NrfG